MTRFSPSGRSPHFDEASILAVQKNLNKELEALNEELAKPNNMDILKVQESYKRIDEISDKLNEMLLYNGFVAEPPPDTIEEIAQLVVASLEGSGNLSSGDSAKLAASLTSSFASAAQMLGARSQGVILFRDASYRLNEARLNGWMRDPDYKSSMDKLLDQVSILISLELTETDGRIGYPPDSSPTAPDLPEVWANEQQAESFALRAENTANTAIKAQGSVATINADIQKKADEIKANEEKAQKAAEEAKTLADSDKKDDAKKKAEEVQEYLKKSQEHVIESKPELTKIEQSVESIEANLKVVQTTLSGAVDAASKLKTPSSHKYLERTMSAEKKVREALSSAKKSLDSARNLSDQISKSIESIEKHAKSVESYL